MAGIRIMGLLGWSSAMQRLYEQIRNAALSEAPVLIHGESGTGKNLTANAIPALGLRREKPFIKMNCSALNDNLLESELFGHKKGSFTGALSDRIGRFEAADGGSILLDEIGDMSSLMQAKLLRVLEEKVVERVGENQGIPVNVRVVSATNRDLPELIRTGLFREDLYYRVNAIPIRTPALRERPDDIPTLLSHFLKKISVVNNKEVRRVSPRAMDILCHYHWPGNVRQLISALEHSETPRHEPRHPLEEAQGPEPGVIRPGGVQSPFFSIQRRKRIPPATKGRMTSQGLTPRSCGRVRGPRNPHASRLLSRAGKISAKNAAPQTIPSMPYKASYEPSPRAPKAVPGQYPRSGQPRPKRKPPTTFAPSTVGSTAMRSTPRPWSAYIPTIPVRTAVSMNFTIVMSRSRRQPTCLS